MNIATAPAAMARRDGGGVPEMVRVARSGAHHHGHAPGSESRLFGSRVTGAKNNRGSAPDPDPPSSGADNDDELR